MIVMKIISSLSHIFNRSTDKSSSAFSAFFTEYSSRERKKIFKNVAEDANADQRELVERYEKTIAQ